MLLVDKYINQLPNIEGKILILCSGGLDSASLVRIFAKKYGNDRIHLLFINYGQRPSKFEEASTKKIAKFNNVNYDSIDISVAFGSLYTGLSSQIDINIPYNEMTARAPGKSHIIYGFASAFCYTHGCNLIATGINFSDNNAQNNFVAHTTLFAEKYQDILTLIKDPFEISIISPFKNVTKKQIIQMIYELDGNVDYFKNTISCYNPSHAGISCGECCTCQGRLTAFSEAKFIDPCEYFKSN